MTEEEHDNDHEETKLKLQNLDDWDEIFKKLGQKPYKEIRGKSKK